MKKKELSNTRISLLDSKLKQVGAGNGGSLHIHFEAQILAGVSGILEVSVNSKRTNLRVGDVMIINSRVPHKIKAILPFTSTVAVYIPANELFFTGFQENQAELALALAQSEDDSIYLRRENEISAEIFSTIIRMNEEHEKKDNAHALFTDGYTKILLGLLHRHGIIKDLSSRCDSSAIAKLSPVLDYVTQNISHEITLEEAAKLNGMNREYFCRFFKKSTGITFIDYINFVRISKAQELLISTQENISAISDELGFSSVSYFARVFKNITNITPAYYRNIKHIKVESL